MNKEKALEKVRLNEKNFERVQNMHVNWYATSIKALMAQLGKQLYEKLPLGIKKYFNFIFFLIFIVS